GRAGWLSDEAAARLGGHGGEAALRAAVRRAAAGDETELELPATAGGDRLRLILSPGRARSGEVVVLARLHEPPVDPARVRANAARLGLTPAEIDVAEALARGLSNPEIAAELGITRGSAPSWRSPAAVASCRPEAARAAWPRRCVAGAPRACRGRRRRAGRRRGWWRAPCWAGGRPRPPRGWRPGASR